MPDITISTLDDRLSEILKGLGIDTIGNLTEEQLVEVIKKLRDIRQEKKLPTVNESGMTLAKAGKAKARKKEHKHLCKSCKAEHVCQIGIGCEWEKNLPACIICTPNLVEPFVATSKPKEEPVNENADT